jgi:hypothetical protein
MSGETLYQNVISIGAPDLDPGTGPRAGYHLHCGVDAWIYWEVIDG